MERVTVSRRSALKASGLTVVSLLASACFPATPDPVTTSVPTPAQEVWQQEWQNLIAEARREGNLQLTYIFNQGSPKNAYEAFMKAFPGITIEDTTFPSANSWVKKLYEEQKAKVFSNDVTILTGGRLLSELRENQTLDPLRPVIFHPGALDEKKWLDGYEAGFMDRDKELGYAVTKNLDGQTWINTDVVSEDELKSIDDLLNPKWKSKMIFTDSSSGFTISPATSIRLRYGEAYLKRLFIGQEPTFSRDNRQITEALVRGKYPIALGVVPQILEQFKSEGLGLNIKPIHLTDLEYGNIGSILILLHNAPHPNTARLFINWMMTQEGQTAFAKSTRLNSRRVDVPIGDPDRVLDPGKNIAFTNGPEEAVQQSLKTETLLKSWGIP